MPYIANKEKRKRINEIIERLVAEAHTTGDINYAITRFMHQEIKATRLCYDVLNSLIGVLSCAQAELYRMVIGKYEDKKRIANGSVSELDAKSLEDIR